MKRKDLTVGEVYKTNRGQTVMVLDSTPWVSGNWSNKAHPARDYESKTGVAVAQRNQFGDKPEYWTPMVAQLQDIAGLADVVNARKAKEDEAARAHRAAVDAYRQETRMLAQKLGEVLGSDVSAYNGITLTHEQARRVIEALQS